MKILLFIISLIVCGTLKAQNKWTYDFIVPDNGNFVHLCKPSKQQTQEKTSNADIVYSYDPAIIE